MHTQPQLKVCLLERILEPVSIYTDGCMMIIYFCLKGSQRHPEFHPHADHSVKAEAKTVISFIKLDETIVPLS